MAENSSKSHPITILLNEWKQGDNDAYQKLMDYVYADLKKRASAYMKNERPDHTLQTTGLVHEAFIKLIDKNEIEWHDRQHFMAIASKVMRRIIVDYARHRNRDKRGGKNENIPLEAAMIISSKSNSQIDLIVLDEALNKLSAFDERQAKIVELKYFGDMTLDEIAEMLDISRTTVKREWNIAKSWLRKQLE
jgi:RNA polymerase sigma factor (TIGR02999 family)